MSSLRNRLQFLDLYILNKLNVFCDVRQAETMRFNFCGGGFMILLIKCFHNAAILENPVKLDKNINNELDKIF